MMIQMISKEMREEDKEGREGRLARTTKDSRTCMLLPDATEKRQGRRESSRNGSSLRISGLISST